MMKKTITLFFLAAAVALAASCVNETLSGVPGTQVTFSANSYYDNGLDTKTAYSNTIWNVGGAQYERIDWVDGDKIRIYSPEATHRYESTRHWQDYNIIASSITPNNEKSTARIENETGQNGLVWGNASAYSFYALYPSPRKSGASFLNADLLKTGVSVTAPIPAHQAQLNRHEVVVGTSGRRVVYDPDMNYAYMYAAESGVSSGANVDLKFRPLMTAFEFYLGNDSDTPLVLKDIFLSTDNTSGSTDITGTFTGTISANNTFTVTSVTGAGRELHADLPEFANGGTVTINKGKPIAFTLFALPKDISHLSLKVQLADNSFLSIAFKYNDTFGGGWYTFQACRKYRITNINTPEEERFTYTIEVFDPVTGALIGVTESDRMTLYGHETVSKGFSVRSYRKSNLRPTVYEPVLWKIQYTTDDGANWTDLPDAGVAQPYDATFKITSQPRGTGVDNTSYNAGEARTSNINGTNTHPTEEGDFNPEITRAHLRNADPRGVNSSGQGSPALAFDLSKHAVYGNINAVTRQNTANSYVISAPGWYKFPLVYGNAITGGQDNKSAYWPAKATSTPVNHGADPVYGAISYLSDINDAYNVDNYVTHYYLPQFYNGLNNKITSPYILSDVGLSASDVEPVILWQDMDFLTDTAILPYPESALTTPDNIGLTTDGGKDYIWFKIEAKDIRPGNIVIALRTKSSPKTILWSWHIWVTERDLNPADVVRGITLMPTNLGFIDGSDGAVRKYADRGLRYRAVSYTMEGSVLTEQATQEFLVIQIGDITEYLPSVGSNPYYQWGRKDPMIPSLPGGGSRYIIRNPDYPDLPAVGGVSIPITLLPASNTANYAAGINAPYKPFMNQNGSAIAKQLNPIVTGASDGTTGWVGGPVFPYYKGYRLTKDDHTVFLTIEGGWLNNLGVTVATDWESAGQTSGGAPLVRLRADAHMRPGPYPQSTVDYLTSNIPAHFSTSDFEWMPYTAAERSASALAYNLWNSFIYSDHVNTTDNKFKTIYDPCPPGFTVPVKQLIVGYTWPLTWEPRVVTPPTPVRRELVNPMSVDPPTSIIRTNNKGVYYDDAFFPYTGGRIIINTNLDPMEQGTGAYYWSDHPFNIQPYENQANPTSPTKFGEGGLHFYQFSLILSTNRAASSIYSGSEKAWSFTKGSAAAIRPMVDPHYAP